MTNLDVQVPGAGGERPGTIRSLGLSWSLLPLLALLAVPLSGAAQSGAAPSGAGQATGPEAHAPPFDPPAPVAHAASLPSPAAGPTAPASRDFLFRRPAVSLGVKGGLFQWRAQGQLYDFTVDRFTAERSDFRGGDLGIELGLWPTDRWGLTIGIDGSSTTLHTEDRDWEEADGTPIFQSTRVQQGPALMVGLRGYLLPRGEQLSRFAWVPSRAAPFLAAGAGYTSYAFEQEGDFVEESPEGALIFAERFESQGSSWVTWVGGGTDVTLTPRLALTLEGRYQWGDDELSGDFRRFEPIDLSGLRLTAGLSVRF